MSTFQKSENLVQIPSNFFENVIDRTKARFNLGIFISSQGSQLNFYSYNSYYFGLTRKFSSIRGVLINFRWA